MAISLSAVMDIQGCTLAPTKRQAQRKASDVKKATVWVSDPLVKLFPDTRPPAAPPQGIKIETARNEYESAQIALRSSSPVKGLKVTFTSLKSKDGKVIPSSALKYNFVGFVPVRRPMGGTLPQDQLGSAPGEFPDPLLPGRTVNVAALRTQPVWITLYTSRRTAPGTYRGSVTVKAKKTQVKIPIEVEVWPLTLPDECHLLYTNWFNYGRFAKEYNVEAFSDEFYKALVPYLKEMRAHRQNITWVPNYLIKTYREKNGTLSFDYSGFDRHVEVLQKHGLADVIEITHLGGRVKGGAMDFSPIQVTDRKTDKPKSDSSRKTRGRWFRALQEHLKRKGWLGKSVLHVSDEPFPGDDVHYRKMVDFIRKHAPEIRLIDAILSPYAADHVDVPVPTIHHFYQWQGFFEAAQRNGKEVWFYTCCHPYGPFPNRFLHNTLLQTRILYWMNRRYHLPGYLHWAVNWWTDDPFSDQETSGSFGHLPAGDMFIVYPGKNGPLSSIRWEALRDGIEDYEYFYLLDKAMEEVQKKLGKAAKGLDPKWAGNALAGLAVRTPADYVRDPELLRSLRRRVAQAVLQAKSEPLLMVETMPSTDVTVYPGGILVAVRGAVEPGSRVCVNGAQAEVQPNGTFLAEAWLPPKAPSVKVTVERKGKKAERIFSFRVVEGTGAELQTDPAREIPITQQQENRWLFNAAYSHFQRGEHEEAIAGFEKLARILPKGGLGASSVYNIACAYALMGKPDKAYLWLEKAIQHGWDNLEHMQRDADLETLRKDKKRWERIESMLKN